MTGQRKYHLFALGILLAGLFLLVTELRERVEGLLTLQKEIAVKEELTEGSLTSRERELWAREVELTSLLSEAGGEIEQGEAGVIGFLNSAARHQGVKIETLTPSTERKWDGRVSEIPIAIEVRGSFVAVMRFVNEIERGSILFHVAKCDLKKERGRDLVGLIETTAVLVERGG